MNTLSNYESSKIMVIGIGEIGKLTIGYIMSSNERYMDIKNSVTTLAINSDAKDLANSMADHNLQLPSNVNLLTSEANSLQQLIGNSKMLIIVSNADVQYDVDISLLLAKFFCTQKIPTIGIVATSLDKSAFESGVFAKDFVSYTNSFIPIYEPKNFYNEDLPLAIHTMAAEAVFCFVELVACDGMIDCNAKDALEVINNGGKGYVGYFNATKNTSSEELVKKTLASMPVSHEQLLRATQVLYQIRANLDTVSVQGIQDINERIANAVNPAANIMFQLSASTIDALSVSIVIYCDDTNNEAN